VGFLRCCRVVAMGDRIIGVQGGPRGRAIDCQQEVSCRVHTPPMNQTNEDEVKVRCTIRAGEKVLWSSMAPDAEAVCQALWDAVREHDAPGYERELGTQWVGELSRTSGLVVKDASGDYVDV
jgi:hypothetical protein